MTFFDSMYLNSDQYYFCFEAALNCVYAAEPFSLPPLNDTIRWHLLSFAKPILKTEFFSAAQKSDLAALQFPYFFFQL